MDNDELMQWAEEVERQHQQWLEWLQKELDRDCPPPDYLTA